MPRAFQSTWLVLLIALMVSGTVAEAARISGTPPELRPDRVQAHVRGHARPTGFCGVDEVALGDTDSEATAELPTTAVGVVSAAAPKEILKSPSASACPPPLQTPQDTVPAFAINLTEASRHNTGQQPMPPLAVPTMRAVLRATDGAHDVGKQRGRWTEGRLLAVLLLQWLLLPTLVVAGVARRVGGIKTGTCTASRNPWDPPAPVAAARMRQTLRPGRVDLAGPLFVALLAVAQLGSAQAYTGRVIHTAVTDDTSFPPPLPDVSGANLEESCIAPHLHKNVSYLVFVDAHYWSSGQGKFGAHAVNKTVSLQVFVSTEYAGSSSKQLAWVHTVQVIDTASQIENNTITFVQDDCFHVEASPFRDPADWRLANLVWRILTVIPLSFETTLDHEGSMFMCMDSIDSAMGDLIRLDTSVRHQNNEIRLERTWLEDDECGDMMRYRSSAVTNKFDNMLRSGNLSLQRVLIPSACRFTHGLCEDLKMNTELSTVMATVIRGGWEENIDPDVHIAIEKDDKLNCESSLFMRKSSDYPKDVVSHSKGSGFLDQLFGRGRSFLEESFQNRPMLTRGFGTDLVGPLSFHKMLDDYRQQNQIHLVHRRVRHCNLSEALLDVGTLSLELVSEKNCTISLKFEELSDRHLLSDMTSKLESDLLCPVTTHVYISPRTINTLDIHTDPYDVFVVQLEGTKLWKICLPRANTSHSQCSTQADRALRREMEGWHGMGGTNYAAEELDLMDCEYVETRVGDALYIPRSFVHVAEATSSEPSMHITFGLQETGRRWKDVVMLAVKSVNCFEHCDDHIVGLLIGAVEAMSPPKRGKHLDASKYRWYQAFPLWKCRTLLVAESRETERREPCESEFAEFVQLVDELNEYVFAGVHGDTRTFKGYELHATQHHLKQTRSLGLFLEVVAQILDNVAHEIGLRSAADVDSVSFLIPRAPDVASPVDGGSFPADKGEAWLLQGSSIASKDTQSVMIQKQGKRGLSSSEPFEHQISALGSKLPKSTVVPSHSTAAIRARFSYLFQELHNLQSKSVDSVGIPRRRLLAKAASRSLLEVNMDDQWAINIGGCDRASCYPSSCDSGCACTAGCDDACYASCDSNCFYDDRGFPTTCTQSCDSACNSGCDEDCWCRTSCDTCPNPPKVESCDEFDCKEGSYKSGGSYCQPCSAGKYSAASGATSASECMDCAAGSFSALTGASACSSCSPGKYQPNSGATGASECTDCVAGKYAAEGASECTDCVAGTYSSATGASSSATCTSCTAGTYSSAGASTASTCTDCPAPKYAINSGSATCDDCAAGYYLLDGTCTPCNTGTYSPTLGATSFDTCVPCEAGKYADTAGASVCTDCPAGTSSSSRWGSSLDFCAACIAGKYASPGSTACLTCEAGTRSSAGASTCATCVAGTYSSALSETCSTCAPGTYSPQAGATSIAACLSCEAGKYSGATGASTCASNCAAGKHSAATGASSTATCVECLAGKFTDTAGASTCSACVAGKFSGNIGVSACADCAAGTYSAATGATSAAICAGLCATGKYSTTTGATGPGVCQDCTAGKYLPTAGSDSEDDCVACAKGKYTPSDGLSICADCVAGKYLATTGNNDESDCVACGTGTYSTVMGAADITTCQQCPAGKHLPTTGNDAEDDCLACARGTYTSQDGRSVCTNCVAGTYLDSTGNDDPGDCVVCGMGKYSTVVGATAAATCQECAAGTFSAQTGASSIATCLNCAPGKYMQSRAASACTLCFAGKFATASGATSETVCADCDAGTTSHASGAMCAPCTAGKYATATASATCTPCPAGTYSTILGASTSSVCLPCAAGTFSVPSSTACGAVCPAGSYGDTQSAACQLCPAGKYSTRAGNSDAASCVDCVAGKYVSSAGSDSASDCIACIAGTFSTTVGAPSIDACQLCVAGKYSTTTGNNKEADCIPCGSGKYVLSEGSDSASDCIACIAGTFSTTVGASSVDVCQLCVAGTYSNTVGSNSQAGCIPCVAGKYSTTVGNDKESDCARCDTGKYSSAAGADNVNTCRDCEAGKFSNTVAASSCDNQCAAGKYSAETGATTADTCLNCLRGTFAARSGASACLSCTPGTFGATPGASSCSECGTGTFSTASAATSSLTCMSCVSGKYLPTTGNDDATDCIACGRGKYSPTDGLSVCSSCNPGKFSTTLGARDDTACKDCDAGKYTLTGGNEDCTSCPAGKYSSVSGASSCSDCRAGSYSSEVGSNSDLTCLSCGKGYVSAAGSIAESDCQLPTQTILTEAVRMVVSLPMTRAEFDDEKQQAFKEALAKTAGQGVRPDHVFIDTIEAMSTAARRLLAQGIRVTVSVRVPDKNAATAIAASLTEAGINTELERAGLPPATVLEAAAVGATSGDTDGGDGGGGDGDGGGGMGAGVVGGIVSGVVLVVVGLAFCQFRRRIFPEGRGEQNQATIELGHVPYFHSGHAGMKPTTFYHATSEENALRIQEHGFKIPDGPGGLLGRGVYCTSTLAKAMDYLKGPYGGVILQLSVDLGRCKQLEPNDPMMKTWQKQYDSAWAPFSAANPNDFGKQENCVKDPKRIKVVQAIAGNTAALRQGGYEIIGGRLCRG